MNGTGIAIAIIASLLFGIGLALLGGFCYFMIRTMKGLQDSAAEVTRAAREALSEAKSVVSQAEKMLGESSPLARAAKAVSGLSNNLPEIMGGLKVFNETFSAIYRTSFNPEAIRKNSAEQEAGDESQFIPYSENDAAQVEVTNRVKKERLVLSEQELAMMRTDRVVERPEQRPPTASSLT